jgi:hypothetical protein
MSDNGDQSPVWPKVVAGGVTSIAGYALGGPVGAVAGAMASPVAERFLTEVHRELFLRGEIVLAAVADESDMDTEQLLALLTDNSELKALFARVVLATSSTALQEKLRGLGRALGRAIVDDTKIDEAFCLVSALDEMELPHFRLLTKLTVPPTGEGVDPERVRGWTRAEILQMAPGMDLVGHSILGVLIRHGLVEEVTPYSVMGAPSAQYAASDLGGLCLQLVRQT